MFPPVATRGFRRRLLGTVAPPQQRVWLRVRAVDGADYLTACWHSEAKPILVSFSLVYILLDASANQPISFIIVILLLLLLFTLFSTVLFVCLFVFEIIP